MQRASKRAPQWLRDLGVFILVMGGAVGICMLLSACYDDNNPFATSVFILAVVLISRFTNGYLPGVLAERPPSFPPSPTLPPALSTRWCMRRSAWWA